VWPTLQATIRRWLSQPAGQSGTKTDSCDEIAIWDVFWRPASLPPRPIHHIYPRLQDDMTFIYACHSLKRRTENSRLGPTRKDDAAVIQVDWWSVGMYNINKCQIIKLCRTIKCRCFKNTTAYRDVNNQKQSRTCVFRETYLGYLLDNKVSP